MKNIYRSAAQVTVFSTVEKFLSFVYRIILTRIIGAEGLGIYQISLTVFAVFLTAASSGIPVTVSRLIAKSNAKNDITGKHSAVTAGVACTLAVTVPIALILFFGKNAFSFLFSDPRCADIFVILLPGLVLTSVYAVIRGSFWGNKQFLAYSVIELAEDAVMVGVGIALIFGVSDPVLGARYATIAVLASYIFSFTVSLFWYFKSGGRFVNPKKQFKPLLSAATPVTAMRTSTSLLNSVIAVLLPTILMSACGLSNSEAVSLYGIAVGMAIPTLFIPSSFIGSIAVVAAPELSENFYKGNTKSVRYDVEKTLRAAIFIATILIPILFAAGGSISKLLYDNELCGQIVQVSAFIMLPMCITLMSNTLLNSMNCEKKTLIYFTIGAVAMMSCVLFLTRYLGVYSYVLGLGLAQIITAILNLRLLKKKCEGTGYMRFTLMSVAVIVAASVFGTLVHGLMQNLLPLFWLIVVSSCLIILFTLAILFCLNMISIQPIKKMLHKN
ncbi:MAG: oligosaccharide flippase family protein [Clostridiales bacterium]|nr:oligosaccharide flippase family protein [Clostridiales bacterium]